MKLELLMYFVQVVESRSFTQAAKKLFITQPALTMAMNSLEEDMNLKLLKRSNKGVIPTTIGLEFYHDCKEILHLMAEKEKKWKNFSQIDEEPAGNVHILAISAMFSFILNDLIIALKKQYPKITIISRELYQFDFLSELQISNTNIGLSVCFLEEQESLMQKAKALNLNFEPLCEDQYNVFMSRQNFYAKQKELSQKDCAELAAVVLSSDKIIAPKIKHLFNPNKTYYLGSKDNMFQFIAKNNAVGIFLEKLHYNNYWIENGFICQKRIKNQTLLPSIHYLITAKDNSLSSAEKMVIQQIQRSYEPYCTNHC